LDQPAANCARWLGVALAGELLLIATNGVARDARDARDLSLRRAVPPLRNRVQMVVCRCGFKTFNLWAPSGIEGASKRPAGRPPVYDNAEISASNTGGQVEQFE
jgi:hypothetical protein